MKNVSLIVHQIRRDLLCVELSNDGKDNDA